MTPSVQTKGSLIILNGGRVPGRRVLVLAPPPRELDLERVAPEYYSWDVHLENGLEYFRIRPGPILDRLMLGRTRAIAQFLELGLNVVADDVIWKREWLLDALRIFAPYRVYFVGVFVSDEEGARREQLRGDRHGGWDRGSARYAHHDARYDLRIDTTHQTPWGCAEEIKHALHRGLAQSAFEEMRWRYLAD
jgi:chloramphenicol 3-O phosphotransferase